MTLTPAYGRDYTSAAKAIADFEANKDFVANTPTGSVNINKEELKPGTRIQIRYKKLTQVVCHVVK